ncbi:MAG: hypothetical protein IJW40_08770 [Clostridia bacterium]|nr:hypothetical protein [Clostridia bacterium]
MKKTLSLRIIAMLLALLLCSCAALISCADQTNDPSDGESSPDEGNGDQSGDDGQEGSSKPPSYLPLTTYDGAEVHILEWSANQAEIGSTWIPWEEIDVDEGDGDPLNNAIYDRNGLVEETYDVVITKEYRDVNDDLYTTTVRTNESSGDQAYQMITLRTFNIPTLCMENLMMDMNTLEYLHTDMPWWSQDSVHSYTMGDALFFAAPEMLLRDKGATAVMFFNQKIAADENIEDLYTIAEDGEWTWELMIELAQSVVADMNGDDEINSIEDMYGLEGGERDLLYLLYSGTGMKFADIDADGYLQLNFGDDVSITTWQEIMDSVMYTDFYFYNNVDKTTLSDGYSIFRMDRALFKADMVKSVLSLRNMESDYGVLPIPKYDKYQDDYSSLVWMHYDSVLGIPGSCTNADMVSVVLEYMSYLSYQNVYPIFYDTIILGKSARDEQSKQMLELAFKTRMIDPGQVYLGAFDATFLNAFILKNNNPASLWGSIETQVAAQLDEYNQKIDELS